MEKERNSKIIAIVALLVAVVGVSIGFAAYTETLTIKSSASVTPSDDFHVYLSTTDGTQSSGEVTPVVKNGGVVVENPTTNTNGPKADAASLSDDTISGLKAYFTAPGQEVTYTFYAHNASDYVAYLNSVVFAEVTSGKTKKCEAVNAGTTGVDEACADISVTVKVNNDLFTTTNTDPTTHSLGKGLYEPVIVTIAYANNQNRANGDFNVTFGDITLTYNEVEQ